MTETRPASVLLERRDAVAIITLNRPHAINAFDTEVRTCIPQFLEALELDPQIRAIVLTGAGPRGFCAGADIKEGRTLGTPVEERQRLTPSTWIEALDRVSKPVIAAIHGVCLGGGLELALACDIRVAASDARLGLPETALGLIPGGGGTQRLPRLIGQARALDMLLSGEPISAAEAFRIGLVTRLADTQQAALDEAVRLATLIASRPPTAVAYCKEATLAGGETSLTAGLRIEKALFAILTGTEDRIEAAAAFREKRAPRFSGH